MRLAAYFKSYSWLAAYPEVSGNVRPRYTCNV